MSFATPVKQKRTINYSFDSPKQPKFTSSGLSPQNKSSVNTPFQMSPRKKTCSSFYPSTTTAASFSSSSFGGSSSTTSTQSTHSAALPSFSTSTSSTSANPFTASTFTSSFSSLNPFSVASSSSSTGLSTLASAPASSSTPSSFLFTNASNSSGSFNSGSSSPYAKIRSVSSPAKLDVVTSDWAPGGSGSGSGGNVPGNLFNVSPVKAKRSTSRVTNQMDRFIPTRSSSFSSLKSKMGNNGSEGYNIVFDKSSNNAANSSVEDGSNSNTNTNTNNNIDITTSISTSSLSSLSSGPLPLAGNPSSGVSLSRKPSTASLSGDRLNYQSSVAEACGLALNTRILEFQPAAPQSSKPIDLRSQYNRPLKPAVSAQLRRKVPTAPERVLDAPGIIDDYYLNLLDWSCDNQVAIALEKSVYIWNAESGTVAPLMDCSVQNYISSVKWSNDGAYLSIGLSDGDVQIWDVEEQTKLRSMYGHAARVGVTSWNKHIVSSGCRDGSIWNHDVRIAQHKVSEYVNHTGEVCGLEWRSDGVQLASGGNDNLVNIWDARSAVPKFTKTNHKAAVKAIAWCPWQLNLLSTGGGSYDKHIHFWNSTTGARVNSIDTGSQVTSLKWSTTYKEIVSSHGFPNNQISIWSYPSLTKNVEIVAHDSRVLHSALSPDGQTLATCASDENLKFWKIFENVNKKTNSNVNSSIVSGKDINNKVMMIR